jgi:SAM-dependent methyltransferase
MTPADPPQPARMCPACWAADPIADHEPLWPPGWRCPRCGHGLAVREGIPCLAPNLDGQDVGFDPALFARLAQIEAGHFWFEARNELVAWLLVRYAPQADRVLEVGCGTGFVLQALRTAAKGARVAGSELHRAALALARSGHGTAVELFQADARQPCLNAALDVVCAFDVLEHIEEDGAALRALHDALRPGGVLLASVPQHPWLWGPSDDVARHVRRYRAGEIEDKASAAGLEVVFADSFVSLLLPAMALSRLVSRIAGRAGQRQPVPDRLSREFEVGPILNRALRAVLRLEHGARRAGLRLPIGGSRVIVARKPLL